MKIETFLTEKWMNDYERQALYNLTDTSSDSLSVEDLLAFDPDCLKNLSLDYGWIQGDPRLRAQILKLYANQDDDTLAVCCGALQANEMVMAMLLKPGDEVVTFSPGYQQYSSFPAWLGCSVREIALNEKDWQIDFEALEEALGPQTRLLVFASPSNPTGTHLTQKDMERIAALCRQHGVWILCDEVYRNPLDGTPSLCDLYEKGIVSGSLSKLYGLAGLRVGWIKGPAEVIEAIQTFRDYTIISAGPLSERLAAVALEHQEEILKASYAVIEKNRRCIEDWLSTTPRFSCVFFDQAPVAFLKLPEGTDSETFARALLEQTGIFLVPGSCFFMEGYARLGLGKTHDDLKGVLKKLDDFAAGWLLDHLSV